MNLNELAKEIHANSVSHGWWDEDRGFLEIVALCHSELSEALEEYRTGRKPTEVYGKCRTEGEPCEGITCDAWDYLTGDCKVGELVKKPEGIAVEMIDCMIRILDWCAKEGVDVEAVLKAKYEYNKTRPYKHGGKRC